MGWRVVREGAGKPLTVQAVTIERPELLCWWCVIRSRRGGLCASCKPSPLASWQTLKGGCAGIHTIPVPACTIFLFLSRYLAPPVHLIILCVTPTSNLSVICQQAAGILGEPVRAHRIILLLSFFCMFFTRVKLEWWEIPSAVIMKRWREVLRTLLLVS